MLLHSRSYDNNFKHFAKRSFNWFLLFVLLLMLRLLLLFLLLLLSLVLRALRLRFRHTYCGSCCGHKNWCNSRIHTVEFVWSFLGIHCYCYIFQSRFDFNTSAHNFMQINVFTFRFLRRTHTRTQIRENCHCPRHEYLYLSVRSHDWYLNETAGPQWVVWVNMAMPALLLFGNSQIKMHQKMTNIKILLLLLNHSTVFNSFCIFCSCGKKFIIYYNK